MSFSAMLRNAVALLLMACVGMSFAQDKKEPAFGNLPDFSATEVRGAVVWKVYHSGSKLRADLSPAAAAIWAPEEDKVYHLLLLPKNPTCVVMKSAQSQMLRSPLQLVYGPNTTKTASPVKEVVDGHTCTVLDAVTTSPDGEITARIWTADDLKGVPLRIDLHTHTGTLTAMYRDVVVGTPETSLFVPPMKCIPPEKTYQVAPGSKPPPRPSPTDKKASDHRP